MRLAATAPLAAILALGAPALAQADDVTRQDAAGRTIHFDVQAPNVNVDWYAALLRRALHGDELSTVTIRIVPASEVGSACGSPHAGGCYGERRGGAGTMTVPAGETEDAAHTLLHEYGHHVDRAHPHDGLPEPNGTALWWKARGMATLVRWGSVQRNYSVDWERSIAEIYAEDYARANLPRTGYRISFLDAPDANVLLAIRQDLGADHSGRTVVAEAPAVRPVEQRSIGAIGPHEVRDERRLGATLLGPGRRVTLTAQVSGSAAGRARVELRCSDGFVRSALLRAGQATATIDVRPPGPASCRVRLASLSSQAQRYALRLRIGPPAAS